MDAFAGFDLSPAALFAGMAISSIGLGLYLFGKRNERLPQLISGMGLMAAPLFVHSALAQWGVCALVVGGLWAVTRLG